MIQRHNIQAVDQIMKRVERRIAEHSILRILDGASIEEITSLKKQYGDEVICIGEDIIHARNNLNAIIIGLKESKYKRHG